MALPRETDARSAPATILPQRRSHRVLLIWVGSVLAVLLVLSAGGAAFAARWDQQRDGEFLPGVTVNGIAIGGMDLEQARRALQASVDDPLDRPITVTVAEQTFVVTPRELGATSDVDAVLAEAARVHRAMPASRRVWHRMTGSPVTASFTTASSIDDVPAIPAADPPAPPDPMTAFVDRIAAGVEVAPTDAAPRLGPADTLLFDPGSPGRTLDRAEARRRILEAAREGEASVDIQVAEVPPARGPEGAPDVLVVKVGDNKLLHYRAGALVKSYDVATGSRRYATPKGLFRIVNKRFRPTWVNPAKYPGGWGASLPARIGPGPGNPLGTRALDLNVGGIRIHGTSNTASIGYNVSHGCIRMRMPEVEELFELVGVGTPVLVVETAPLRSQPAPAPPTLEDLAEADGTAIPGVAPTVPAVPVVPPSPAAPVTPPSTDGSTDAAAGTGPGGAPDGAADGTIPGADGTTDPGSAGSQLQPAPGAGDAGTTPATGTTPDAGTPPASGAGSEGEGGPGSAGTGPATRAPGVAPAPDGHPADVPAA